MAEPSTKQSFPVTPTEVAALVQQGFVVTASYAATHPRIYLDLSTNEGVAQGEALLALRGASA